MAAIQRIDTHQHLFYPDRFAYDWAAGFPAFKDKAFTAEDYRTAAATCPLAGAIFMEVDVREGQGEAESAFFCGLAEDPASGIVGVVAAARPEWEDFEAQLERLAHPRLLGLRRVLHTQPDELSTGAIFRRHVASLGRRGLTFDMCFLSRQLPLAAQLADAAPDTQLILDHCGVPDITGDPAAWKASITELARRPNVACKISGIIAYGGPERANAATLRPFVEHVIASFGWDRVVWGSDWPVCDLASSYAGWVSVLDEILAGEPAEHLANLYERNARRMYFGEGTKKPA